jgi:hypothetical protein
MATQSGRWSLAFARRRVHTRRAIAGLALGATLAVVTGACVGPSDPPSILPLARDLPADTTLRLPATRPPKLIDAGLSSGNGTTMASFYSLNESIVTVCGAAAQQCLSALPTAQVLERADTGPDVTVLIEAGENGVVPLSDELEQFWTQVDLVAGRPAWLSVP